MLTATELLRRGRRQDVWTKYCGFLDLEMAGFMEIQERLLMEQMALLGRCEIGRRFLGAVAPTGIDEFRERTPITTYQDYEPYLGNRREDVLPEEPYLWAHTSGRSGALKWIPYTRRAYESLGERVLGGLILAAAKRRGDVRLEIHDVLVANTPPRPYLSGIVLRALAEHIDFQFVPSLEETEQQSFQERIESGFQTALATGIDVLGSISVVLVKMGERFAEGAQSAKLSTRLLDPRVLSRLARGWFRSKLDRRPMLPRDIWRPKVVMCGGMDTSIYRDRIEELWGVTPFEQYGSTEGGILATQTWNKRQMTFFPEAAFLEFIPESEWAKWRQDSDHVPKTVLMNEVMPNKRYEVVLTSFYGQPLLRYRTHDLIEFVAMEDEETQVRLPQMTFVGRSGGFIDLAGFTGLMDEKMVWEAIVRTRIPYEDWAMRKEANGSQPILHLYLEPLAPIDQETVRDRVDEALRELNPYYSDYQSMIGARPLRITLFPRGTFGAYMMEKQAAGADLAHLKPPHMNAPAPEIALLERLARQIQERQVS